ncbi:MAG: TorF family putative porin [Pseudomonadota bacterium]
MGKMVSRALALALIAGGVSAPAAFAEGEFSGNIALTSDYVYRGITQADGAPTIQGGFDWASDDFYVGVWASGVDFGDGTSTEIDYYAGWTPTVGEFGLDLGVIYYSYPDAPDDPEQAFVELYAGASTTLGMVDVGASVAYSPEFYAETGPALYWAASAGVPLGENFGVDVSVGYSDAQDDVMDGGFEDYTDYSIGLTTSVADMVDLDFRYIDTDLDGGDEAFVVTVSRSL